MIVILDKNEQILEFLDDSEAEIEIDDVYKGYKTLSFECKLNDVIKDKYLYRQGNRIFVENILFVINTDVQFNYVSNIISFDAEEVIYELNNCSPFYIADSVFSAHVNSTNIIVSKLFLERLLIGFYEVGETDIAFVDDNDRIIQVNGTITKYNLLKQIEDTTGLIFKREYLLKNNKIIKRIHLLKPENYGTTHDKLLESVVLGENTNKLAYSTDESKNALGIMPIITAENTDTVNYSRILKQFNNLDINNAKSDPSLNTISFTLSEIIEANKNLLSYVHLNEYLPEQIIMNELNVGIAQLFGMTARAIVNISQSNDSPQKLQLIYNPAYVDESFIDAVYSVDEMIEIANIVAVYIESYREAPSSLSTNHGRLSFHLLVYLLAKCITTNKQVIIKTAELKLLSSRIPEFVQEEITVAGELKNLEYMPYLYTQNSQESNKLPYSTPVSPVEGVHCYDLDKYISESYPIMYLEKEAGKMPQIRITKQNISQDSPESFGIFFKNVEKMQDNSKIEIDFSKKTIKFMKFIEKEVETQYTETTNNTNVITVNHMPSCTHCKGASYKRYTKTWKNYCPLCKSSGTLRDNPKKVYEGELTCSKCDADYCGYCGYEKIRNARGNLTPAEATTTTTKTKTEVTGEYKEVTASEDASDESDTKVLLEEIITAESSFDSLYGDVSIAITGAVLEDLTCDSTKIYELSPFPYIKRKNQQFIYAPIGDADFNYTHMTNDNPKLEPFETSEQSVEEVLIGCWKKLNGSGDSTAWLEKSEDINVDLVESFETVYNVGDFVYIKLPDTRVFKAQITEKKYNPKLKGDSSLKIGNITRESLV